MAVKRGLGKGLDGLIGGSASDNKKAEAKEGQKAGGPTMVKLAMLEPNRQQPRKYFDEDSLIELSESIKRVGIICPLLVQKKGDYYEIIAGERRWRASKLAGLKEVPVVVKDMDQQETLVTALIENIQREGLNPIEEAQAYKSLIDEYQLKQDEVAEQVGKSRTTVTNTMRLLKLDERVQQMLIDDMISMGHARALLAIEDKEQQFEVAGRVFDEKLSVRDIEKIVKKLQKEPKEEPAKNQKEEDYGFIYKDLEEKMAFVIGTKVHINNKSKGKGKIEIDYYSDNELDRIMQLIMSIR
ncbi:MAG: ParB/RepB/Spo0J family partition protein [Lachnospiraceae bacterium]|nr:ParB/RepB/Spo0J family partition protein [Lachnospiraceae bacterium]